MDQFTLKILNINYEAINLKMFFFIFMFKKPNISN